MKTILPFALAALTLAVAPASAQTMQNKTVVKTTTVQRHRATVTPVVRHDTVTTRNHRRCHWTWRNHRHVKVCRTMKVRTKM